MSLLINAEIWRKLYEDGRNDLLYPNDVFVRCCRKFMIPTDRRVLDYGFGTGANLLHLARSGYQVSGTEISEYACDKTLAKLQAHGLEAELKLMEPGAKLPWSDGYFDVVVSWQVLYYNDIASWHSVLADLERVLRPGGLCLVATAAPGDISHLHSDRQPDGTYLSRVPSQEGCVLVIPTEQELLSLFPGQSIEIGEMGYRLGEVVSRHWVVAYRKL